MPAFNDLLADVETRSRIDLKKSGARRYAADPSTQITTAVWEFRGITKSACTVHPDIASHTMADFYNDIRECGRFVAHHAGFDVNVILKQNPFVQIPLHKIDCTMARAQALALPGKLEGLCRALGLEGKDPRGHQLVMATCKPKKDGTFNEDRQTFIDLLAYNLRDKECLKSVDARLAPLTPSERIIWERTWRKNEIGIPIDMHLATAIALRRQEIEQESTATLMELTANAVTKLSQRKRIVDWANSGNRAAGLDNTQKHVVAEKLQDENLHPDVRLVLELLQSEGGSAPMKAQALLDRSIGGYYKDATRFFGARSGRGTSEGANLFNIARPSGKYDIGKTITELKAGQRHNNVALTDCLRGCIVSPDGWTLCDNDLSNAELRIALWMAGDTERLNILATPGSDLYMANAIKILKLPPDATKNTHPKQRQVFKSVTLGGNYELGPKTYMAHQRKEGRRIDINEASVDIYGYRDANPLLFGTNGLLPALKDAFKFAIYEPPGRVFPAGKIAFQKDTHGTVWMLLPSGRAVPHYSAHVSYGGEMAFFRAKFGTMLRQRAFGGSLLEIACVAGDTEILTDTGLKRITDVHRTDMVWDGKEWVSHGGLVCRGRKETVLVKGFNATSDHLTMYAENRWCGIGSMDKNQLRLATDLAFSLLPDLSKIRSGHDGLPSPSAATFKNTFFKLITSAAATVRDVLRALTLPLLDGCRGIQSLTGVFGPVSITSSHVVQTPKTQATEITGVAALQCTRVGLARVAESVFSGTCLRCRGTIIQSWTLIGSRMKKATNPEISVSAREALTPTTGEKLQTSKTYVPVYDLLDCGPLNRFTIRTRTGHFLLVHNCQSMTRDLITAAEEDIENELPDVYVGLDVYDSILAWAPKNVAAERSEQMRAIMRRPRTWTAGLPLDCEGYESDRMRK